MRSEMIATAAAFALVAGTAMAQTAPPSATNRTPAPGNSMSTTAPAVRTPAPDPLKMEDVSKISGSAVYRRGDNQNRFLSDLPVKPENKTIHRFLGHASS